MAVVGVVTLAVMRLDETFVEQLRRNRPFDGGQSGWIYRLIAIAAVAQALYVGFAVLRSERVKVARERDEKLARLGRGELVRSVARNAAATAGLSLVYGLSAFALTGERAGFWLFFVLVLLQLAWYYRSCGQIAAFMSYQPEFVTSGHESAGGSAHLEETAGHPYSPPIARGVDELPDEG